MHYNSKKMGAFIIDRDKLPIFFPTHRHSSEFWEHLGRTIATFGSLEEVLGRAIFSLTGTRPYSSEDIEDAFAAWQKELEIAVSETLPILANKFKEAAEKHPDANTKKVEDISKLIKEAAEYRNVFHFLYKFKAMLLILFVRLWIR